MIISYKEHKNFMVESISIVWKNKVFPTRRMEKDNNMWIINETFPPGKYYYRFLINEGVYFNDPYANQYEIGEDGSLWSVLLIDNKGQRLYNAIQYSIELERCFMSNQITEYNDTNGKEKKIFNKLLDHMVSLRFDFINIIGIHSISLLWFNPYEEIFDISENILSQEDVEYGNPISVWFNLDLRSMEYALIQGLWKVRLFINGEFIIDDYFQLGQGTIYTNNGRVILTGDRR